MTTYKMRKWDPGSTFTVIKKDVSRSIVQSLRNMGYTLLKNVILFGY